jgi:hypothetical protein
MAGGSRAKHPGKVFWFFSSEKNIFLTSYHSPASV